VNTSTQLVKTLRQAATDLGFSQFGITPAVPTSGYSDLVSWIDSGYAGEMGYFATRQQAYQHPNGVLAGTKSIIALTYPYEATEALPASQGKGRIAKYIWSGLDYHDVIHPKLKQLCKIVSQQSPQSKARGVVDTAPLMEREIAKEAGLGWQGKNTLLLNKHKGSYFFLACILCNIDLPSDESHQTSHCGTCRACLDACPTEAFPSPGVLDATRCISYLTIEHRSPIPAPLREGIGDWLFGCDICQEVCPWNRKPTREASRIEQSESSKSEAETETASLPLKQLDLPTLFELTDEQFRQRFRKTPLWRARRRGILRNAAIVLGNQQHTSGLPALNRGLEDTEALVRGASAWALGRIGEASSRTLLKSRLKREQDPEVMDEISLALSTLDIKR
jgi:epoxyqueuosine reductase